LAAFGREFPTRFFDVGICEQHALGLASGLAAAGLKPVVGIYSTFLQRGYDQVFHDLCLQGAAVVLGIDRAGIVGDDGPTHHGVFDIAYLRHLPGIVLMAPKDAAELQQMVRLAVETDVPCAIRYPRAEAVTPQDQMATLRMGESETLRQGQEAAILAYGAMVKPALEAAERLARQGIAAAVINARFAKPLDRETILSAFASHPFVVTVEDHALAGGFGSAVLELASESGADTRKLVRLGIPDRFIEHGARNLLLKKLGLDPNGIERTIVRLLEQSVPNRSKQCSAAVGRVASASPC
jgi:1-deoxy-D-xylulose-5-phosphate synthase